MSSTSPTIEAATNVKIGSQVSCLDKKLSLATELSGKRYETIAKTKTTSKIVTHITMPPNLGVPVSFSLCRLLNTEASSPEIAFWRAVFFQSLCLYKKFIKMGLHNIAKKEDIDAAKKILITLKIKGSIIIVAS
jgi:hypothetical protein